MTTEPEQKNKKNKEKTVCPRCAFTDIETVAQSPVDGAWEVLQCAQCLYMWRTTEPARRTEREHYPESFRMTAQDIADAPEVPAVPPLAARAGA